MKSTPANSQTVSFKFAPAWPLPFPQRLKACFEELEKASAEKSRQWEYVKGLRNTIKDLESRKVEILAECRDGKVKDLPAAAKEAAACAGEAAVYSAALQGAELRLAELEPPVAQARLAIVQITEAVANEEMERVLARNIEAIRGLIHAWGGEVVPLAGLEDHIATLEQRKLDHGISILANCDPRIRAVFPLYRQFSSPGSDAYSAAIRIIEILYGVKS